MANNRDLLDELDDLSNKLLSAEYRVSKNNLNIAVVPNDSRTGMRYDDLAVQEKRCGQYENALMRYLDIIHQTGDKYDGVISATLVRNIAKVIIALNLYSWAFTLLYELEFLLSIQNPDKGSDAEYTMQQAKITKDILYSNSKTPNSAALLAESKSCSGNPNYEQCMNTVQIHMEMRNIMNLAGQLDDWAADVRRNI